MYILSYIIFLNILLFVSSIRLEMLFYLVNVTILCVEIKQAS